MSMVRGGSRPSDNILLEDDTHMAHAFPKSSFAAAATRSGSKPNFL
jgi:hypothetical protein